MQRVWWEGRRLALERTFPLWQALGVHITPNHYYSPIPDTRRLSPTLWSRQLPDLPGVDLRGDFQLGLLQEFDGRFGEEYRLLPSDSSLSDGGYYIHNGSFESVDGEVLYCMIRKFRPRRYVEVGAGASTLLTRQALLRNREEGSPCEFVCIEPYPSPRVRKAVAGFGDLVDKPLEEVGLEVFTKLRSNDILFIDSTHVVRIGGDVIYEILEILPRLSPGVVVHLHDIFLPAHYPRNWVLKEKRFWTEQYLFQAFLAFNSAFEVLWGGSYMHLMHADQLAVSFPSYHERTTLPGSFWIRRTMPATEPS